MEAARPRSSGGDQVDASVDLRRALSGLPRREREAVALFYLLDLTVHDVAETMGVATGTVKTLLHRGRAALLATMRPGSSGGL